MSTSNLSEIYKVLEHRDHVLQKSDTYLGSKDVQTEDQYILDTCEAGIKSLILKEINYIPAMYKLFDELLVNAADHVERLNTQIRNGIPDIKPVTKIWVTIDKKFISVKNNGTGIDIERMPDQDNKYPPEIIFGELLASTNFNEQAEKIIGGKNGYGAKLANIFSTKFQVTTVDNIRKLIFNQTFQNNMSIKGEPIVSKYTKEPYTEIKFYPDFVKFDQPEEFDDITIKLFSKRVYDIAMWTGKKVNVYLNDELIKINSLSDLCKLNPTISNKNCVYESLGDRWEVVVSDSDDDVFTQLSYVNAISTFQGGKHVDHLVDAIGKKLIEFLKKKHKLTVKLATIRNQLFLVARCVIVNPSFTSQTKEYLSTSKKYFGSLPEITPKFIDKIVKNTDIVSKIIQNHEYKNKKVDKTTDGMKKNKIYIDKLSDANLAGTKESKNCILILSEGDSAKTMVISGLSSKDRDRFGVFPLRGKLLNVKDTSAQKIQANKEYQNLKKILGLQTNADYGDIEGEWPLRYGEIWIMTDQDEDGFHIKGLLINMIHSLWPSLLRKHDFIASLLTPIVKATKGKQVMKFYNLSDYEEWKESTSNSDKFKIKYYKGLGTSNSIEAKEYFKERKLVKYVWGEENDDNQSDAKIDLAFNKKKADLRKKWLQTTVRKPLDYNEPNIPIPDYIDRELIYFSDADNARSLPHLMDGLKESSRKILYCCFKRNLIGEKSEIKVAQLSGYVSEHSAYHHGEMSLQTTIINMAQDFVGSNNYSILIPSGQFGTRLQGGKDASSARYIFTYLTKHIRTLFNPKDDKIYNYRDDDGTKIEPTFYAPSIPMILVNGSHGIGTGFSCHIPNHNIKDVVRITKKLIKGKSVDSEQLTPYYNGFAGHIVDKNGVYVSLGKYEKTEKDSILITELPVGTWNDNYIQYLNKLISDKNDYISNYQDNSNEKDVRITIKFRRDKLVECESISDGDGYNYVCKLLKLMEGHPHPCSYTNMCMFDKNNNIVKYKTPIDIIKAFVEARLPLYQLRKDNEIKELTEILLEIQNKYQFINKIIKNEIVVMNRKQKELDQELEEKSFTKMGVKNNYAYLHTMPINQLTEEKFNELKKKYIELNNELKELHTRTPRDMWLEDIDNIKY